MTTYQALYYPFIHFKSDAWVKLAALYWDKLGRIVPQGYATHDSPTVKALGSFVVNQPPVLERPDLDEEFCNFIIEYGPKLKEKYGVSESDPSDHVRLAYVHHEKLGYRLYEVLKKTGLVAKPFRGLDWIPMHPRLANVYMTALAEELSAERGMRPLTDETRDHVALSELSTERLAQALLDDVALVTKEATATELEAMLVSVAFQSLMPTNLDAVKPDQILEFREKYPEERSTFQETSAQFLKSREWLESIPNPKVLDERLRDEVEKAWAPKLKQLREKMKDVGIDTVLSCFGLKTTLPAAIAWMVPAAGGVAHAVVVGAAALAFNAIPVFRDKRKAANDALKGASVSYLYRLEQELKPKDLAGQVTQGVQRFVLGI